MPWWYCQLNSEEVLVHFQMNVPKTELRISEVCRTKSLITPSELTHRKSTPNTGKVTALGGDGESAFEKEGAVQLRPGRKESRARPAAAGAAAGPHSNLRLR